ncbi:MAG: efflux transporter outer membrane subunit, partial [Planctomycetota bacterium]
MTKRLGIAPHGVLLGVTMCLGACTVGPDYTLPVVPTAETWRVGAAGEAGAADRAWWGLFQDPALDALIDEAVRNNYDIQVAAARVEEFAARVGITRSAAFPQISYGADAGRSQISREIGGGKSPTADRVSDFFNANLNVGWELDLWGRIRRSEEAARAELLSAEEARRGVVLTLVTSVANGYIGLRSLDEQLTIARQSLQTRADTVELFELQFSKGVISQLEVAQVRSEFERTAASIPALERDIALLENSLSVLLGRAPGPIQRGRAVGDLAFPPIPAGLPSDLLRQRPDLLAAEQDLIAANARIGAAIAEFYPRLSLTGLFGVASDDLSNIAMTSATLYDAAASVVGPIFTAGLLEGQVDAAEAAERGALAGYIQSILTALREAEDALITRSTTDAEAAAQSRQVDALRSYAGLARQRYDNGFVGYLEVLDADRDLFDAELQRVQLLANRYVAVINIYKAFGGGWVDVADVGPGTGMASAEPLSDAQD